MNTENSSVLGEESEDDFDWEEVEVGQPTSAPPHTNDVKLGPATAATVNEYYGGSNDQEEGPSEKQNIEITIKTHGKPKGDPKCVLQPPCPMPIWTSVKI